MSLRWIETPDLERKQICMCLNVCIWRGYKWWEKKGMLRTSDSLSLPAVPQFVIKRISHPHCSLVPLISKETYCLKLIVALWGMFRSSQNWGISKNFQLKEKGKCDKKKTLKLLWKMLPEQTWNLYRIPCLVPGSRLSRQFCPSCSHLIVLVRRSTKRRAFQ